MTGVAANDNPPTWHVRHVAVAAGEVCERHLIRRSAQFGIYVVNLPGEAARRQPFCHCIRIEEHRWIRSGMTHPGAGGWCWRTRSLSFWLMVMPGMLLGRASFQPERNVGSGAGSNRTEQTDEKE